MTTKTEVVTAINLIKTEYAELDLKVMEFLSDDIDYGTVLPYFSDLVTAISDFMTKFSSWKTDATFKSISDNVRTKIFKSGSIVSNALGNHKALLDNVVALFDEALSTRKFSAEHPYLQRKVEKEIEDLMVRISGQIWKLDKIKNMTD